MKLLILMSLALLWSMASLCKAQGSSGTVMMMNDSLTVSEGGDSVSVCGGYTGFWRECGGWTDQY